MPRSTSPAHARTVAGHLLAPQALSLSRSHSLSDVEVASASFYPPRRPKTRTGRSSSLASSQHSTAPEAGPSVPSRHARVTRSELPPLVTLAQGLSSDPDLQAAGPEEGATGYRSRLRTRTKQPNYTAQVTPEFWPWEKAKRKAALLVSGGRRDSSTSGVADSSGIEDRSEDAPQNGRATSEASGTEELDDRAAPTRRRRVSSPVEEVVEQPPAPLDLMALIPPNFSLDHLQRLESALKRTTAFVLPCPTPVSALNGGSALSGREMTQAGATVNGTTSDAPGSLGGAVPSYPTRRRKTARPRKPRRSVSEVVVVLRRGQSLHQSTTLPRLD